MRFQSRLKEFFAFSLPLEILTPSYRIPHIKELVSACVLRMRYKLNTVQTQVSREREISHSIRTDKITETNKRGDGRDFIYYVLAFSRGLK